MPKREGKNLQKQIENTEIDKQNYFLLTPVNNKHITVQYSIARWKPANQ